MLKQQAFRYQLMPDGAAACAMRRTAGCRRWVMNTALRLQQDHYAAGGKYISYVDMAARLKEWRAASTTAWLKEAPFHTLQQALRDLDKAFKNFFAKRAAFPKFRKKGHSDSFRFPDPVQFKIDEVKDRMFLPKLGWIRYRNSRQIAGEKRNLTISAKAGKWYASIQTRQELPEPVPMSTTAIGIDVGVTHFVALSDGSFYNRPSLERHERNLKKYQRRMSRKKKFGKNWHKAKASVTRAYAQLTDARKDYSQKTSTTLSKNHALVAHEDLRIGNMTASAAGTVEQPGAQVAQKRALNKAIRNQAWGEFFSQLDYKLAWNGGYRIAIPPQYTSQTCPCCKEVDKASRKTRDHFLCTTCWYENHADTVGAINVLDRAYNILSCEGQDIARIACEVNGVVMPSAAGTHRSDLP